MNWGKVAGFTGIFCFTAIVLRERVCCEPHWDVNLPLTCLPYFYGFFMVLAKMAVTLAGSSQSLNLPLDRILMPLVVSDVTFLLFYKFVKSI